MFLLLPRQLKELLVVGLVGDVQKPGQKTAASFEKKSASERVKTVATDVQKIQEILARTIGQFCSSASHKKPADHLASGRRRISGCRLSPPKNKSILDLLKFCISSAS